MLYQVANVVHPLSTLLQSIQVVHQADEQVTGRQQGTLYACDIVAIARLLRKILYNALASVAVFY